MTVYLFTYVYDNDVQETRIFKNFYKAKEALNEAFGNLDLYARTHDDYIISNFKHYGSDDTYYEISWNNELDEDEGYERMTIEPIDIEE